MLTRWHQEWHQGHKGKAALPSETRRMEVQMALAIMRLVRGTEAENKRTVTAAMLLTK